MTWGWPGAFWLMFLLVPLIGLFLQRRRAVPVVIPSSVLWMPVLRSIRGRPLGRRIRRILTLLVQAAVLCGLILALTDPRPAGLPQDELVLVLDASATMQTKEAAGQTRWDQAVFIAGQYVSRLPSGTRVTIVRAAGNQEVLLKNESDRAAARAVLATIQPGDIDADLHKALHFAQIVSPPKQRCQVVCISDFCGTDTELISKTEPRAVLRQVGSDQINIGITGVELARDSQELAIGIARNQPSITEATLVLRADGHELARQTIEFTAEAATARLPFVVQPGHAISISLEPADALPLDNVKFGVCPARNSSRIRLVTPGNVFLEQAILAQPSAQLQKVRPEDWVQDENADLTILDGPSSADVRSIPGRFIVVNPGSLASAPAGSQADEEVTWWLADHRALRNADPLSWGAIAPGLSPPLTDSRVLVAANNGVLLYEWPDPGIVAATQPARPSPTTCLVFNFDVARSELPLRSAFPVLLWDSIDCLLGRDRSSDSMLAGMTGESITTPWPAGDAPLINTPAGHEARMLAGGPCRTWLATEKQGLYTIRGANRERQVALNWISNRSAERWRPMVAEFQAACNSANAGPAIVWPYIVIVAMGMAVLEWLLFQTRRLRMD